MTAVTELGYVGLGVSDTDAWKHFAGHVLALEVDEIDDQCFLRMDYWHHRIVLIADGSDDVRFLGLRVAGADEFGQMQKHLTAAGVAYSVGSEEEAAERFVLEVLKLNDPGDNAIEIFHGPEVQYHRPFHPGRRAHRCYARLSLM